MITPKPAPVPYSAVAAAEHTLNEFVAAVVTRAKLSPILFVPHDAEVYLLGVLGRKLQQAQAGHREWVRIHSERLK